ncbi:MAG: UDP-N-acetylmuramate--L-alanine ligase [Treponema sp.]|uniref:UDP-N-acetylmuramate--L-alanine ligase n=1 Tax=Treponema sp. TaxID=166 RepID=UPI002A90DF92|nr:UDP-N-acetylmuramate--L-alanine ligase [Treponema sp.]MDY6398693.1 UDP-N-acetylmuramate--L-alanine ligase [Treponema sp.]
MNYMLPNSFSGVHFHFVGIKGTGMVALVEILHARGAVITGSDVSERFYTDEVLEKLGIKALPFSEKNITSSVQFVIYSSAYSVEKNPDLIAAKKQGLPMMLYSEALGAISQASYSCGVCGVHGKTTTTGLCGTLLKELPLSSQVLAGSIIKSFGDSCTMTKGHDYFVAETCEYQRHFMAFAPKKIILTSVESDHQDYYPTYEDIRDAFVDYICKLPQGGQVIYCADDKGACEAVEIALQKRNDVIAVPYGVNAAGDYKLKLGRVEKGVHYFDVASLGECAVCVPGDHNVRNACAALALVCELLKTDGKNPLDYIKELKNGLKNFAGGKRRSEIVGRAKTPVGQDVIFIDDYGHHPTAIKTTLAGFKEFYKGHKIIVDFMSHTYTRTAALLEEFASSFDSADKVIINKIYGSAREDSSAAKVTGEILAEHAKKYHKDVVYAGEFDEAAELGLKMLSEPSGGEYPDGYVFVTMGAGDNWKVGKSILEKL